MVVATVTEQLIRSRAMSFDDDSNLFLSDSHDFVESLLELFIKDLVLLAQMIQLLIQSTVSMLQTKNMHQ